ncbi:MAG: RNA 2',3'-cyclic phosphodiesterase [Planctomycetaceae bacterium]
MAGFLRIFAGCRIAADERLDAVLDDFESRHPGFRCVRPGNLHVTICFLGEIPDEVAGDFADCLTEQFVDVPEFDAAIGGPGGFPASGRASIVWLSVTPTETFTRLNARCVEAAEVLGLNTEERPFHPHLTIARMPARRRRWRRPAKPPACADIREFAEDWSNEPVSIQRISSVTVFSSQLAPGGSIYRPLREIPLASADPKSH